MSDSNTFKDTHHLDRKLDNPLGQRRPGRVCRPCGMRVGVYGRRRPSTVTCLRVVQKLDTRDVLVVLDMLNVSVRHKRHRLWGEPVIGPTGLRGVGGAALVWMWLGGIRDRCCLRALALTLVTVGCLPGLKIVTPSPRSIRLNVVARLGVRRLVLSLLSFAHCTPGHLQCLLLQQKTTLKLNRRRVPRQNHLPLRAQQAPLPLRHMIPQMPLAKCRPLPRERRARNRLRRERGRMSSNGFQLRSLSTSRSALQNSMSCASSSSCASEHSNK